MGVLPQFLSFAMINQVPIVDLFSGPGGLAEGFVSYKDSRNLPRFNVVLSIEMESTAYRTLRLRNFLRKFPTEFPEEYYEFLNEYASQEPEWSSIYPSEWRAACNETLLLKLGSPEANSILPKRLKEIRALYGDRTVLLGGPPCQSYSVVGRARNVGNPLYRPENDKRQSLYMEYVNVLRQLQPAAAIMENVRGILSAKHGGRRIFADVMNSLANAGGKDRYRLYSLNPHPEGGAWFEGVDPKTFVVRSEQHDIPQKRHRVFIICIRQDLVSTLARDFRPTLCQSNRVVSVKDIIGEMPMLRSRLSRSDDGGAWQQVVKDAHELVRRNVPSMTSTKERKFLQTLDQAKVSTTGAALPFDQVRGNTDFPDTCPYTLREWIYDPNINRLPNNETRGHIDQDIARYLYAAVYARTFDKSPRVYEFPPALAAKHRSWCKGKFNDRFRVQLHNQPSTTITSHISKDGHYFIHPDPAQSRSLTVREVARLQTFPDNYYFHGGRTQQYVQVGNAVPPYLAKQIAQEIIQIFDRQKAVVN